MNKLKHIEEVNMLKERVEELEFREAHCRDMDEAEKFVRIVLLSLESI